MPALSILLAATVAAGTPSPAVTRYALQAHVDPPAHRVLVHGTVYDPSGKETPIESAKLIHHLIEKQGEDYARGFAETPGTIQAEGVFLSGSSKWYPPPRSGGLLTFDLIVTLPPGWDAISQGRRQVIVRDRTETRVRFVCDDPQEEIWLVAGPWAETERSADGIDTLAMLRKPDEALAVKYLDATGPYLALYSKLLGPYPYSKFALVENFWETGYGMPSFTLLGETVLRLPFIITTSYPHEILHNWWGNGVYVAREGGNWSEGLTAYLADHLFAEQHGSGASYRQESLQKYADYASREKDFPLAAFKERHSPATEAVGYGKALMLFHMMRRELGDETFIKGLRALYREKKFQRASFTDIRRALEAAAGKDLSTSFMPWVTRAGAPRLAARDVKAAQDGSGAWHVSGRIEQLQPGDPYKLSVPLAITLEGKDAALQSALPVTLKSTSFDLPVPAKPLRLDVDPEFDLFRLLDVEEAPPALSGVFGADDATLILPASAPADLLAAYRDLAAAWNTGRTPPMTITTDATIADLPKKGSTLVIGFENRYAARAAEALAAYGATTSSTADRAVALVARRRPGEPAVIAFVAAPRAAQVPGLARKLPHYHKYSHLAFEGDEPVNVEKGRWPVTGSPMTALIASDVAMAKLAPREALAEMPPPFSKERMAATIRALAGIDMRGRGAGSRELDRASSIIVTEMKDAGLEVTVDPKEKNVIGVLRGTKPEWADASVVLGAHYDHLGTVEGVIYPGADDNASGVAVLIELARQMASAGKPSRTVVFAAFAGEETGLTGSKHYVASASSFPAAKAIGMVNLDTVGRLGGGKILVLGTGTADEWIHIVNGAGYVTGAPVEAVAADPGGSDQKSFTDAGVPAVQIFTGPNTDYHKPSDILEKIDADGLVKVASVTRELVAYLAERPEPLTSKLAGANAAGGKAGPPPAAGERRVTLGTIPDFAFSGPGVRITGTTPGSPAEHAGFMAGDVITKIGDTPIATLREFSEALKSKAPGDRVAVTVARDGRTVTIEATLVAR